MDVKHMRRDITDLDCSPDNEHFVYSTTSPIVNLCNVAEDCNEQLPLVVDDTETTANILFVSFSADGRELFCGSDNGTIYIYDLKSHRTTLKFSENKQNVNSVRFADDSMNMLYTAGSDGILKFWDRRILSVSRPTPVGYFAGHKRAIMYMDPRGDGRHLITHSKDQTIKLWDVRVLSSAEVAKECILSTISSLLENYEIKDDLFGEMCEQTMMKGDTSTMTYKGHSVVYTMLTSVAESRTTCRFSPVETTGQRYIYTV